MSKLYTYIGPDDILDSHASRRYGITATMKDMVLLPILMRPDGNGALLDDKGRYNWSANDFALTKHKRKVNYLWGEK